MEQQSLVSYKNIGFMELINNKIFITFELLCINGGDILNFEMQMYRNIPIRLINREYWTRNAKNYAINNTNQTVWIPNRHLLEDGTIKQDEDIDYVFRKIKNQLNNAGITQAIPGIKRKLTD